MVSTVSDAHLTRQHRSHSRPAQSLTVEGNRLIGGLAQAARSDSESSASQYAPSRGIAIISGRSRIDVRTTVNKLVRRGIAAAA